MIKFLLKFLFISLVVVIKFIPAFALEKKSSISKTTPGAGQLTNELLDIRNKLENEIQTNLNKLIGTQLNSETFNVGVRVKISVIAPPEPPKNEKPKEDQPAGLDMGVISAKELAESYERQIEELKLKKEIYNENKTSKFQVDKIDVIVGLDSTYDDAYVKKFDAWLKNKIKTDYGSSVGSSTVTKLPKKYEPPKEEPKPENPYQPKYLTFILAALLLMLGLLLLGFLMYLGLKKVAMSTKPLELKPVDPFKIENLEAPHESETDEKNETVPANPAEPYNLSEVIDRLTKKIAFVVLEVGPKVHDLVKLWVDSGDEGVMKTALLVDTVLIAREKIMAETGNIAPLHIPLSEDVAKLHQESLAEAYRSLADMSQDTQVELLEKIYWDLVSVRTLGLQSLRRPFDFLQSMPRENLIELLNTQRKESRALALMYLPSETKVDVLASLDDEDREGVVAQSLLFGKLSDKEIWDADTSVKVSTLNQSADPSEKLVNLFPRTIEVLQSLNILEEIRILRKVCPTLKDNGLILKQQFNTLAFIDEWKFEFVSKLIANATAEEIVTLIRTVPEGKEAILAACSEKVKIIVEDDLNLASVTDHSKLISKLESLRAKFNKIALEEKIPMSKIIGVSQQNQGGQNVAA